MPTTSRCKSEADFPQPHRFGVWWDRSIFGIYRNLSLVKASITSDVTYHGTQRREVRIYEYIDDQWQLIYEIPKGGDRLTHELWQGPAPTTAAVSDASVQAAIASIIGKG